VKSPFKGIGKKGRYYFAQNLGGETIRKWACGSSQTGEPFARKALWNLLEIVESLGHVGFYSCGWVIFFIEISRGISIFGQTFAK